MAEEDRRDVTTDAAPVDTDGAQTGAGVPEPVAQPVDAGNATAAAALSSPLNDVKVEVERILTGITSGLQARNTMFDVPIIDERRVLALYSQAVRMQVKLHAATDYAAVQELRISAVSLESRFKSFTDSRITKLVVLFIAIGVFVTPVVWHTDIMEALTRWFGSSKSMKFITIGVSGFILYWIGRASQFSDTLTGKTGVLINLLIGIVAAVVVPPVIVVLFFEADETLREFKLSPELLSFLCGYSLKVILDLLAKVIEKVNAAVRAL